jgi:diacylglycerol kinase family enzyme
MRITLLHNPKAGRGKHDEEQLMNALAEAGHKARYQSTKEEGWKKTLKKKTDLVLVAGGDGAVAKVAARLVETGVPLAILPLGTANNLARTLGFHDSPKKIIKELERGRNCAFDVGIAHGPWGKRPFFEGAGAGLLAEYVGKGNDEAKEPKKKRLKKESKEQELTRHLTRLRRKLHDYPAQKWKMKLDGKDISGRYILWEAMNIRSVGPALYLAPWATTKDGELDFVAVREEDRAILLKHLDARLAGHKSQFPLPMARFQMLTIAWEGPTIHFDDDIWPDKKENPKKRVEILIRVKSSALVILQPPRATS